MIVIDEAHLTTALNSRYTTLRLDCVRDTRTGATTQLYGVLGAGDLTLGALPDLDRIAATHEEAVEAYRNGDLDVAEEKLSALRWENPSFQTFYNTVLARIANNIDTSADGWWIVDLPTDEDCPLDDDDIDDIVHTA